jgi:hypothetical protein
MIDGKPTKLFSLLQPDGEWNGLPAYKKEYWGANTTMGQYKDRAVLLTRNGKLPYIPITQKQYLLALKDKWSEEKKKLYTPDLAEKDFQKTIDGIRNNIAMSSEMKEKIIADLQKDHDKQIQGSREGFNNMTSQYDKKIKIIDDYLSSHSDMEMQEPVATTSVGGFTGHFGPDGKKTLYNLVRIDPSYFDRHLPRHVPQFIVLYWRCDKNTAAIAFINRFETNFPVSKLKAMVDVVDGAEYEVGYDKQ